jgi:aspartate 1-decarboxylase
MLRHMLKSKIHRATITNADLHYEGSLTVDRDLMEAADLREHEEVHVVNVNNGARLVTYVIPGARGSGVIQLNGAAARLGMQGDLVICLSYGVFSEAELATFAPRIVHVDADNRIVAAPVLV